MKDIEAAIAHVGTAAQAVGIPETIITAIEQMIRLHACRVSSHEARSLQGTIDVGAVARLFHKKALQRSVIIDGLLADTAWHMLLSLTAEDAEGESMPINALCNDSGSSAATAIRHIDALHDRGLICRAEDPQHARRVYVRLTDRAREQMHEAILGFCVPKPVIINAIARPGLPDLGSGI